MRNLWLGLLTILAVLSLRWMRRWYRRYIERKRRRKMAGLSRTSRQAFKVGYDSARPGTDQTRVSIHEIIPNDVHPDSLLGQSDAYIRNSLRRDLERVTAEPDVKKMFQDMMRTVDENPRRRANRGRMQ